MFLLRKPDLNCLEKVRKDAATAPLTYTEVGQTRGDLPEGYIIDRSRIRLGSGLTTFQRAKQAFKTWEILKLGWVEPCWPDSPLREGEVVGTLARACGLWVINVCRIVDVFEGNSASGDEFSFAYGTVAGHVECGEEQFRIEWRQSDDSVWYDITAFSRPGRWISRIAYPYVRHQQRRFARDSLEAVRRCVT